MPEVTSYDRLPYNPSLHGRGSRGADGRCSWVSRCTAAPVWSWEIRYVTGTVHRWAACAEHDRHIQATLSSRGELR